MLIKKYKNITYILNLTVFLIFASLFLLQNAYSDGKNGTGFYSPGGKDGKGSSTNSGGKGGNGGSGAYSPGGKGGNSSNSHKGGNGGNGGSGAYSPGGDGGSAK